MDTRELLTEIRVAERRRDGKRLKELRAEFDARFPSREAAAAAVIALEYPNSAWAPALLHATPTPRLLAAIARSEQGNLIGGAAARLLRQLEALPELEGWTISPLSEWHYPTWRHDSGVTCWDARSSLTPGEMLASMEFERRLRERRAAEWLARPLRERVEIVARSRACERAKIVGTCESPDGWGTRNVYSVVTVTTGDVENALASANTKPPAWDDVVVTLDDAARAMLAAIDTD